MLSCEKLETYRGIPKKIFQTCWTKNLPERWKISQESIKEKMGDWEYFIFDDIDNRSFVEEHFPDFLETYDRFEYNIQRADAIRYMWLYVNGGIYIDCDFKLRRNIEEIIDDENEIYLVEYPSSGRKNGKKLITNSIMISKKENPFWLEVIDEMKKENVRWYHFIKFQKVYTTTGPDMLTRCVRKSHIRKIRLLDQKIAYTNSSEGCSDEELGESIISNLGGKSWHSFSEKLVVFIQKYWILILICTCLIILIPVLIKIKTIIGV